MSLLRTFTAFAGAVLLATALTPGMASATPATPAPPVKPLASTASPLTGTATASSSAVGHEPAMAGDGNPDSYWQPAKNGPAWWQLDLGKPYSLTSVQQTFRTADVWSFSISGSVDGQQWVSLTDLSTGSAGVTFARSVSGLYRYVRLSITGSEQHRVPTSTDFVVSGTDAGVDIAQRRTATASSHLADYEPTRATDGNTSTVWVAASDALPQWLQVDLGAPSLVTAVQQDFKDFGRYSFTLTGSLNGSSWTTIGSYSQADGQSFTAAVARVRYRYVRLTITGTSNGFWAGSTGLKVYGFADLANRAATTASSSATGHGAAAATDGDTSTYWQATGSGQQWLQVDLGASQWVDSVRQTFAASGTWSSMIQGSPDGQHWTTLLDKSAGATGQSFTGRGNAGYRYLRVQVDTASGQPPASSKELQVFGTPISRNLAIGTNVITSTNAGTGWEPQLAVDGKPNTFWLASNASMDPPQWLTADLGNVSRISRVAFTVHDSDTWKFTIEASADNKTWTMLLDQSAGATGSLFGVDAAGDYRYVRVRQTGSGAVHWANIGELVVTGIGSPVTTRWYDNTGSVFRYFPKDDPYTSLRSITSSLTTLRQQGYTAVEIAPPYQGVARQSAPDYFAGLASTNHYAIDPHIGTMADWDALIATAHSMGMKVIMFDNLGYADIEAPDFVKAVTDFRNGVDSPERSWFVLDSKNNGDRWYQYGTTGVWYYAFWGVHDPTYNWTGSFPIEAAKIMKFWADTGIDGMAMDAPAAYYGFSTALNNTAITDVLRNYNISVMPEGIQPTAPPETMVEQANFKEWVKVWHYTTIQDLWMEHWGNPAYSRIINAADNQDASSLDLAMKMSRDAVVALGGITVSSASWPLDYAGQEINPETLKSPAKRLLEASTLTTMGTMNYLINAADWMHPDLKAEEIPSWSTAQKTALQQIYRAQSSYSALGQTGARVSLPTGSDSALAYLRQDATGSVQALVVQNFQSSPQTITVNIANTGIVTGQTPINLLTGRAAPNIYSSSYPITVPGFGYAELAVR